VKKLRYGPDEVTVTSIGVRKLTAERGRCATAGAWRSPGRIRAEDWGTYGASPRERSRGRSVERAMETAGAVHFVSSCPGGGSRNEQRGDGTVDDISPR